VSPVANDAPGEPSGWIEVRNQETPGELSQVSVHEDLWRAVCSGVRVGNLLTGVSGRYLRRFRYRFGNPWEFRRIRRSECGEACGLCDSIGELRLSLTIDDESENSLFVVAVQ
jgi:hypothetical protein